MQATVETSIEEAKRSCPACEERREEEKPFPKEGCPACTAEYIEAPSPTNGEVTGHEQHR